MMVDGGETTPFLGVGGAGAAGNGGGGTDGATTGSGGWRSMWTTFYFSSSFLISVKWV